MTQGLDRIGMIRQFRGEIDERLSSLTTGVMELEEHPGARDLLDEVFREAHTIKGSAHMLDLPEVVALAHGMEDLFDRVRRQEVAFGSEMANLLLRCVDQMAQLIEAASQGRVEAHLTPPVLELSQGLQRAAGASDPDPKGPGPPEHATESARRPLPPSEPHAARSGDGTAAAASRLEPDVLRVPVAKLDRLVRLSCELTTATTRAENLLGRLEAIQHLTREASHHAQSSASCGHFAHDGASSDGAGMEASASYLSRIEEGTRRLFEDFKALYRQEQGQIRELSQLATEARMVSVHRLFQGVRRVVRDLSDEVGKPVKLHLVGHETEVDKQVIDELRGPLLHIVRNSIDHGIEEGHVRAELGKPAAGQLTLRAYHRGDFAVVEVEDDGQGIDAKTLKRAALDRGVIGPDQAARMTDEEALHLIFAPGFTTRAQVSDLSGRGVGLDAIKSTLEKLDGRVIVESKPLEGTRIALEIPLVLSIVRAIVFKLGDHFFALPTNVVERVVQYSAGDVKAVVDTSALLIEDTAIPVASLARVLRLDATATKRRQQTALVIGQLGQRVAFEVDQLVSEETLVVRSLGSFLGALPAVGGAAILGSGEVALILKASGLIAAAGRSRVDPGSRTAVSTKTLSTLLVDDSMNVRELLRSVLESVGHQVEVAVDGLDGLEKARATEFDLVITDVEMPHMNGFELTRRLREDDRYARKPIVIVTTRSKPEDKRRGIEAGASAYLTKSSFNQQSFVNAIARLVQ